MWLLALVAAAWSFRATPVTPPVGGIYERNLTLPILGSQHIRLRIVSRTRAAIFMQGALSLEEEQFGYGAEDDGMTFDLGPRTQELLRRVRTSMGEAKYHHKQDVASVVVKPPVVPAMRIKLHRRPDDDGLLSKKIPFGF